MIDQEHKKVVGIASTEEVSLERQQGLSLKDFTDMANKAAQQQIPRLIKYLFGAVVVGNVVGFGLVLWSGIRANGDALLYSAVADHLRYSTVAMVVAIAFVVSSCTIGIRGAIAVVLKKTQSSGE